MICPSPEIGIVVNYITIGIPFAVVLTLIIHSQRKKIIGGIVNKPSYKKGVAYALNSVYILTVVVILFIGFLFLLGPVVVPGEYAHCVSPLA